MSTDYRIKREPSYSDGEGGIHSKQETKERIRRTRSLGSAFPIEQMRCRELLVEYSVLGREGVAAAAMMREVLAEADRAVIEQDLVAMIRAYEAMKECC